MFFSRKKAAQDTDLSWLETDMHSHLIPGIDDGVPDTATAVELIKGFAALGYKKIITTPHILWEIYPNTDDIIKKGEEEVREALQREGVDVGFSAAAEYFIDEHFQQLLSQKKPLLKISGNFVLVEISMVTAPMDLLEVLFEMQMQDYHPIIAHPERYSYLSRNKEFFNQLKDAGALLQLNLLSLAGHYGPKVKELAEYLLKNEMYDLAGTDLHNHRHLEGLKKLEESSLFKKLKTQGKMKNRELI